MTVACSVRRQLTEPLPVRSEADRIIQVGQHLAAERGSRNRRGRSSNVEPLRRASVSRPMWASWPVRGPQ